MDKVLSTNVLDKWILTRLNETINLVTDGLEKYDAYIASSEVEKFVDDFSLWYIRRSRDRVGPASESEKDRNSFYHTTYYVLLTLCKLLAPFTPFLAEVIYKNLTKEESVHLADYPLANSKSETRNSKLAQEMQKAREVVEMAHAIRKEKVIPVRQPLSQLLITNFQFSKEIAKLIADEVNVKKVISKSGHGEISIKFDTKITPELEEEARVRDLVRKIQEERKNLGLNLTQKVDVKVEEIPTNTKVVQWMLKKAQIASLTKGKFNVKKS